MLAIGPPCFRSASADTGCFSGRGDEAIEIIGGPDAIRTRDLRLRRATLYPAELRVRWGLLSAIRGRAEGLLGQEPGTKRRVPRRRRGGRPFRCAAR